MTEPRLFRFRLVTEFSGVPAYTPSYARCLEGAPLGSGGNPKRTSADFIWCKIALSWGHGIEATAERLLEESSKARENGEAYARRGGRRLQSSESSCRIVA